MDKVVLGIYLMTFDLGLWGGVIPFLINMYF